MYVGVCVVALGLTLGACDSGGFPVAHRDSVSPDSGLHGGGLHDGDFRVGDLVMGDADTVVLDGVSGRISVSADTATHTASGVFRGSDGKGLRVRTRDAGHGAVAVECADDAGLAVPCAGDLSLRLPARTGLRLRQTSGETDLSGIGGPLEVTAASDRLTAVALHSASASLHVTSGSADVGFSGAPGALSVQATSASMTVRLPGGSTGYAVTSAVTSADVSVQVPRDDAAAHRVSLQVVSSSLALLPA
ncbi:hypothetical protein [Streptomyces sp. NBC_01198]|uniref:hypothetical protein n=1 Tax=Streptomyces sp. NBC_01198 TaxID=2903769 RepID=UPI002E0D8626|nr:hypothetical protein OG702_14345 [Streptomyces sp. NBC_01198]